MEEEIQEQRDTFLRTHSKSENPYLEYGKSLGEKYHSLLRPDEILQLRYEQRIFKNQTVFFFYI